MHNPQRYPVVKTKLNGIYQIPRKTRKALRLSSGPVRFALAASVMLLIAAAFLYSTPSASSRSERLRRIQPQSVSPAVPPAAFGKTAAPRLAGNPLLMTPLAIDEGVVTYAADCTTVKSDFNLGDTVCAKATGVPSTFFSWHVIWADPGGIIRQSDTAIANDQTVYRFTLPSSDTTDIEGRTIDNRGTWIVDLTRANGVRRATASFVVHGTVPAADVFVQKFPRTGDGTVASGGNVPFVIVVGNNGPDSALVVHLIDSAPSGSTLASFTQQSGPQCIPDDPNNPGDCVIATLANGDRAEFTAVYSTGSTSPGSYDTSASVSSTIADPDPSNNSSTSQVNVVTGGGTAGCSLVCPSNITASANTTENGQRGAHVIYPDPISSGDCGSITSTPASGSFFPVGTTTVTATSETGGGSCTFSVTVEDTGAPEITCPPDKTVSADSNCQATVDPGQPTTSGDNVTVTSKRSDDRPLSDPYPKGITTITWTATNDGGSTSCSQTITVKDTTPPTITSAPPPGQSASADQNCQAAVPDFTAGVTASDNCGADGVTITQSPEAGTLVGLGSHTITITAVDEDGNASSPVTTTFTVNDTTAPTISCPANIVHDTDPGVCSASLDPGTATATDNCGTPTVTGVRSDGQALNAPYPKGTTTITWTATDASGNHSSCTQTVTVQDKEAPVLSCQANITHGTDPGTCSAILDVTPTATDNCDTPTITGVRSDGQALNSPYPKGTTTVTWTASDSSGNQSSCTETVTVIDTEAPTITLKGNTPSLSPPNHGYHTFNVTDFVASASDNCDTSVNLGSVYITKVTSDEAENGPGSGNTLNDIVIGSDCKSVQLRSEREGGGNGRVYTIYFKAQDAAGNVSIVTAKVIVPVNPGGAATDSGTHYTVTSNCP